MRRFELFRLIDWCEGGTHIFRQFKRIHHFVLRCWLSNMSSFWGSIRREFISFMLNFLSWKFFSGERMIILVLVAVAFEVFKFYRFWRALRWLINFCPCAQLLVHFSFSWTTFFVSCFTTFWFFAFLGRSRFHCVFGWTLLTAVSDPTTLVKLGWHRC